MKKKFVFSTIAFLSILFFSFCSVFAADDMKDGVRNAVGGAENVVEDAAKGTVGAVRNGIDNIGNGARNTVDTARSSMDNNNNNYTAARTNTSGEVTFAGMNATGWTWFVMAISAALIIGLVWYYAKQNTYIESHDNDEE